MKQKQISLRFDRLLVVSAGAVALASLGWAVPAHASAAAATIIGSYDNFDTFNDTGETAEGFEIDIEDISPGDLSREFPSNFYGQPWLIRYGLPTVTAYDWTGGNGAPDADHTFDAGHKGVLVTWAAAYKNGKWVAPQGSATAQGAPGVSGDGTPYVANPTLTAGESCWWWGLGALYPTSGCEHFGVSFNAGVIPGRLSYHWKVPSLTTPGALVNNATEAGIPPSPILTVAPPPVIPPPKPLPPVVVAVARAPVDVGGDPNVLQEHEPQYGDAYWVKTTTIYSAKGVGLGDLQVHNINGLKVAKIVSWKLLQKPPGNPPAGAPAPNAEREAAENDNMNGNVSVTKEYQYFKFSGAYDSETHEALCESFYGSQTAALNSGTAVQVSCQNPNGDDYPYLRTYWTIDPGPNTPVKVTGGDLGTYLGAHVNAYNVQ